MPPRKKKPGAAYAGKRSSRKRTPNAPNLGASRSAAKTKPATKKPAPKKPAAKKKPSAKPAKVSAPVAAGDEAAFLAAIKSTPDDLTAHLVYADWLDEQKRPTCAAALRAWVEFVRVPVTEAGMPQAA